MFRIIWAMAQKSFSRGARLKTQMSKATFAFCCFFIAAFVFYLMSILFMADDSWTHDSNNGRILLLNSPDSFNSYLVDEDNKVSADLSTAFVRADDNAYYDFAKYQEKLDSGEISLVVVFPEDFDARITSLSAENRPQIITYYNPDDSGSVQSRDFLTDNLLHRYGDLLQKENGRITTESDSFLIYVSPLIASSSAGNDYDMNRIAAHMILPFLLFVAIMYAVMESGVSSVAGEKERGTFAAILLTPVRRVEIVLGNALGILLYSMLPAVILTFLLVPLFGLFTWSGVAYVILICLSLSLLLTSLILVLSIMNRSILSAQSSFLPIFFLMLIVCITAMQQQGFPGTVYYYIPFYGHYYGIEAALLGQYSPSLLSVLFASSAVMSAMLLYTSEKLLHVERFTTYIEADKIAKKELQSKKKTDAMLARLSSFPKNIVFGFRPKKYQSVLRLLSRQLSLPATLLAVFQPLSLIAPLILFLRTRDATDFINDFANNSSGISIAFTAKSVLSLFGQLMQSKLFIFSMALSYVFIIGIYIFIVRIVEKNPLASVGLPLSGKHGVRKALLAYARGLIIGFSMMLSVYLLLLATGQIHIASFGLRANDVPLFLIYILMWIPQGASEELMMRGYMLPRLSARCGRAAAIAITSMLFGILHMGNGGFSLIAFLNLLLISVFFALFALHTQEIWTICAAHTIWNFAQGNLFGLQVSSTEIAAQLVHTSYSDRSLVLLTGGKFGPEGGLIVTGIIVLSLFVLLFMKHTRGKISAYHNYEAYAGEDFRTP